MMVGVLVGVGRVNVFIVILHLVNAPISTIGLSGSRARSWRGPIGYVATDEPALHTGGDMHHHE
jgi:hypothetical protein